MDKSRILSDLDLLLKSRHQKFEVWCLENNLASAVSNYYRMNVTWLIKT